MTSDDGVQMVMQQGAWPLDIARCPADRDFLCWLEENARGKMIFHMGPGGHHLVGRAVARNSWNNVMIALTNSIDEMQHYVTLAAMQPADAWWYQVLFGDIYTLNPAMLPSLDIVTLFHVGEMPDERRAQYAHHNDAGVLVALTDRIRFGGSALFYPGSSAWERIGPLVDALAELNGWHREEYRSLLVFTRY